MKAIHTRVPDELDKLLDELMVEGGYPNKSELIRDIIRLYLKETGRVYHE